MNQPSRPVYLQLRDKIAAAILDGEFVEGELLPSVRSYANQQGTNPLTVAKAYQQFQLDGLLEVRRGVGIYVVEGARERLRHSERKIFLEQEWPEIANRIRRLGLTQGELIHFE